MALIISDALQIQFWINGSLTYNETIPPYPINKKCFYQQFKLEDSIIVQFKDATGLSYFLEFYDEDGQSMFINPIPEISIGVYELTFTALGYGISDIYATLKIRLGEIIGTTTEEVQVSIDEFTADTDGWTNAVHPSPATLQDLDDYQQTDSNSPTSFRQWNPQPSGPNIGKPYYVFGPSVGGYSRIAYIELNGVNSRSYDIHTEIKVEANVLPTVKWSAVLIFYDAALGTLGSTGFVESAFAPGVKSFDFTVPAGIGNVKYIGLRVFDDSTHTFMTTNVFTWAVAEVVNLNYANWIWSADNGGALKLTTVNTTDTAVISKVGALPQQNHYVRFKLEVDYPTTNAGLRLLFKLYNGSTPIFSQLLDLAADGSEYTSTIFMNNPLIWSVATSRSIEIQDADGNFVAGDIVYVNSVEIYTVITNYVTSLVDKAKSDLVLFSNNIEDYFAIYYKSYKNFASIIYNAMTPYRVVNIPGVFYKASNTTEQSSLSIGNNKEIDTASIVNVRKQALIEDTTDYMHLKIALILQHAVSGSVLINGVEWTWKSGDSYEETQPDPTYPLSNAKVILTRKNYNVRNVI